LKATSKGILELFQQISIRGFSEGQFVLSVVIKRFAASYLTKACTLFMFAIDNDSPVELGDLT
jgi:hypothetical protein